MLTVETRRGRVPIEKIKVGDEVLARNMATGKLEYRKVIALTRPHKDKLLALKFEGEHAVIRATPAHPFWIEHAGHAPAWITAGSKRKGDFPCGRSPSLSEFVEDPARLPNHIY